jgi:ATP-dependent DNA helicase RecQ
LIARQQMQQVIAYGESTQCRRRALLAYFGEDFQGENCGNCDNCLRPVTVMEDRTIDAQKFLSCVSRTQQRFGMRHIIDILRGANTQRIRDFGHNTLTTYGIGKEYSVEEWTRLGRSLLQQGLLAETQDGYPILKLNRASVEILKRERNVEVPATLKPAVAQTSEQKGNEESPLTTGERGLFEYLRKLRKGLADEKGVPPYVIFPDATLRSMAQQRPQTEAQFLRLPGVGTRKSEAYFLPFTEAIRRYSEQHQLTLGETVHIEAPKPRTETPRVSTTAVTLSLYKAGRNISEIARERGMKYQTIITHLAELIETGEDIRIDDLVRPGNYELIVAAFAQVDSVFLKPAKDLLGDRVSYDELHFVRAHLRRTQPIR